MINGDNIAKLSLAVGLGKRAYRRMLLVYPIYQRPAWCFHRAMVVETVICVN